MASALVGKFGELLRQYNLLEAVQLAEFANLEARFPQPRALARELIQRDWLTPYQINQLFQGRGHSLVLGQYVLLERLGEGGMGQVFKARHRGLGRVVAIKVIRKECMDRPTTVRRFQREVQAVAKLSHPNVVRAFDAGEADGTRFFAMEYVEGIDLARLVKERGPLPIEQACDYIRQAALGLQHAHECGLVHRDIKPSNLLVDRRTRPPASSDAAAASRWGLLKILDMGLARLDRPEDVALTTLLTQDGLVLGTPDFIAPEQARNSHDIDIRADLYSLGCTLYYLLTGKVPFNGNSFTEKVLQHQLDKAPPVEELRPEVPAAVAAVVQRLMDKRPEDRYRTPAELAAILANVPAASGPAVPVSKPNEPEPTVAIDVRLVDPTPSPRPKRHATPAIGSARPMKRTRKIPVLASVAVTKELPAPPPDPVHFSTLCLAELPSSGPLPQPAAARKCLFWVGSLLCLLLLGASFSGHLSQQGPAASRDAPQDGEAARRTLERLSARAIQPGSDKQALRDELLRFRMNHAGTALDRQAGEVHRQLPSDFDRLDPARIAVRFAWQPRELVAVLGWRRANPARKQQAGPPRLPTRAAAFSPDGRHVAGTLARVIRIWDPANSLPPAVLRGHENPVLTAAYSPDGKTLATASEDGKVILWDAATGTQWRVLPGHKQGVDSLVYAADGRTLVSASWDGTVKLWDAATGKQRTTLQVHGGKPLSVALTPDGKTLAIGTTKCNVQLWDVAGPVPRSLAGYTQHTTWVWVTAFSPDGKTLVSGGGGDGNLRLCSWDDGKCSERAILVGHKQVVHGVAFAPDGKTLVSVGRDSRVILWDAATGARLRGWELRSPMFGVAYAADGRHLLTANGNGTVFIFRLGSPPSLVSTSRSGRRK